MMNGRAVLLVGLLFLGLASCSRPAAKKNADQPKVAEAEKASPADAPKPAETKTATGKAEAESQGTGIAVPDPASRKPLERLTPGSVIAQLDKGLKVSGSLTAKNAVVFQLGRPGIPNAKKWDLQVDIRNDTASRIQWGDDLVVMSIPSNGVVAFDNSVKTDEDSRRCVRVMNSYQLLNAATLPPVSALSQGTSTTIILKDLYCGEGSATFMVVALPEIRVAEPKELPPLRLLLYFESEIDDLKNYALKNRKFVPLEDAALRGILDQKGPNATENSLAGTERFLAKKWLGDLETAKPGR